MRPFCRVHPSDRRPSTVPTAAAQVHYASRERRRSRAALCAVRKNAGMMLLVVCALRHHAAADIRTILQEMRRACRANQPFAARRAARRPPCRLQKELLCAFLERNKCRM